MERQTTYTVEQLIGLCEEKLKAGGHNACSHDQDPEPFCKIINEIGVCAVQDKDKSAQKYLTGLLSHPDRDAQLIALCYLLMIQNLEQEDKKILDYYKNKKENDYIVREALRRTANQPN